MNPTSFLLLSLGLCAAPTLASSPLAGSWSLGGGPGLQRYSGNYGAHGSYHLRAQGEYHGAEWWSVRLFSGMGNINSAERNPGFRTEWFSQAGLEACLKPDLDLGPWPPFATTGLGSTFGTTFSDLQPDRDLDWNLYVPVSVGVERILNDRWSAWILLETYLHMQEGDYLDGIRLGEGWSQTRDDLDRLVVGFSFRFGACASGSKSSGWTSTRSGNSSDADLDGVPDHADLCPGSPRGVPVDAQGCPEDADHDGVADLLDQCPSTPPGYKVDPTGCSIQASEPGGKARQAAPAVRRPEVPATAKPAIPTPQAPRPLPVAVPVPSPVAPTPATAPVVATGTTTQSSSSTTAEPSPLPEDPKASDTTPPTPPPPPVAASALPKPVPTKPAKPVAAVREKDTDGDGVPDVRDRCRSTPGGAFVDSVGCSAGLDDQTDADRDGIPDIRDLCSNSRYGMRVDSTGCQLLKLDKGTNVVLEDIAFQAGTARLLESSLPVLEHAARVIRRQGRTIEVAGFTERRGSENENKELSHQRAEVVKGQLLRLGVPPALVTSKGYGSAEPIADNTVEAGRDRNRRIELRVR